MVKILETLEESPFYLRTKPAFELSHDEFFRLCADNPHMRLERNARGDIIILYPEGGADGAGIVQLASSLVVWVDRTRLGEVFGSTGFILPNDATRSPDVAWVSDEKLAKVSEEEWEKFLPLCPDFVLELRSKTDSLRALQRKMREYVENGARLAWLIDPYSRTAYIYRPRKRVETRVESAELSGETVLPGFTLKLEDVWRATSLKRTRKARSSRS